MFKGSYVALITPFSKGRIDEKKLRELVEWHLSKGTDGFVPVGTTGESPTLTHKEHARVIEVVTKAVRKRVPVIAGAGSNSTAEAISLSREAEAIGADGVLSVNPYYNRPTQEGLTAHFAAIARSIKIPVILYNIPSRTGVNLLPSTIALLANQYKNIIGVKEATGNIDQSTELAQRLGPKFLIFSGDDSLTLPIMSAGGCGVISVAANILPKTISELCEFALQNDYEKARALHLKLFPVVKNLFIETNPGPVKAAMYDLGLIEDESLRLPLVQVSSASREKIQAALKEFGLSRIAKRKRRPR